MKKKKVKMENIEMDGEPSVDKNDSECVLCSSRVPSSPKDEAKRLSSSIGDTEEPIRSYLEYFSVIPEDLIVDEKVVCRSCYSLIVSSSNLYKEFAESVEVLKEIFRVKHLEKIPETEVVKIEREETRGNEVPAVAPNKRLCQVCKKAMPVNSELCRACSTTHLPSVKIERAEETEETNEEMYTCLGDIDSLWQTLNEGKPSSKDDGAPAAGQARSSGGRSEVVAVNNMWTERTKKLELSKIKEAESRMRMPKRPTTFRTLKDGKDCTYCQKRFRTRTNRIRHERKYHVTLVCQNRRKIRCRVCSNAYLTVDARNRHMEAVHSKRRNGEIKREKVDGRREREKLNPMDLEPKVKLEIDEAPTEKEIVEVDDNTVPNGIYVMFSLENPQGTSNDGDAGDYFMLVDPGDIELVEERPPIDFSGDYDGFGCANECLIVAGNSSYPADADSSGNPSCRSSSAESSAPGGGGGGRAKFVSHEDLKERRWPCRYCRPAEKAKQYRNLKNRVLHEKAMHADEYEQETFFCGCCNRKFQGYVSYMSHMRGDKAGVCDVCGSQEMDVVYHMKVAHNKRFSPYQCDVCGKRCLVRANLNQHRFLKHNITPEDDEGILACDLCTKVCFTRTLLKTHLKTHFGIKPYHCKCCPYATVRRSRFVEHYKKEHAGEEVPHMNKHTPYDDAANKLIETVVDQAPGVGAGGSNSSAAAVNGGGSGRGPIINSSNLAAVADHSYGCVTFQGPHRNYPPTDWEQFLKCRYCDVKSFPDYKRRTAHEMVHHKDEFTVERRFVCSCCYRRFPEHDTYYRHMKGYYKGYCEECKVVDMDIQEHDRKFHLSTTCELCGKVLRGLQRKVIEHMRTAHGILLPGNNVYECEDCGKDYIAYSALNQHRWHQHKVLPEDEEDIHRCDMCPKIFFTKGALRTHKNRHLGAGKYCCPYCRYVGWHEASLMKHCQAVHGKVRPIPGNHARGPYKASKKSKV